MPKQPNLRILVVDDNEDFVEVIKQLLEQKGYNARTAVDGEKAKKKLKEDEFDLVITDVRMPLTDGIELIKWSKGYTKTPFIMMSGYSQVSNAKNAERLGARNFIPKPFDKKDLFEAIDLAFKESENSDDDEEKYYKLKVANFLSGIDFPHDIFVKLNEDKYVKVAHTGQDLDEAKIKSFHDKNIKFLYIRKSDFKNLLNFKPSGKPAESTAEKRAFIRNFGETLVEYAFIEGLDEDLFNGAKNFIQFAIETLTEEDQVFDLLQSFAKHSPTMYSHSVAVSFFSMLICQQIGWNTPLALFKATTGGLFHDIGKKELPKELIEKPFNQLSHQESKLLETHTVKGYDLLRAISSIPKETALIALEHHEDCIGHGFPKGAREKEINPLSLVASLANNFCNLAIRGPKSFTPLNDVFEFLFAERESYHKEALLALASLFKINSADYMKDDLKVV